MSEQSTSTEITPSGSSIAPSPSQSPASDIAGKLLSGMVIAFIGVAMLRGLIPPEYAVPSMLTATLKADLLGGLLPSFLTRK